MLMMGSDLTLFEIMKREKNFQISGIKVIASNEEIIKYFFICDVIFEMIFANSKLICEFKYIQNFLNSILNIITLESTLRHTRTEKLNRNTSHQIW